MSWIETELAAKLYCDEVVDGEGHLIWWPTDFACDRPLEPLRRFRVEQITRGGDALDAGRTEPKIHGHAVPFHKLHRQLDDGS